MKKVLILANNAVGLYNFRFELIKELLKCKYEVYFSIPEADDNEKVKLMIEAGAKHIQTLINRRGTNPIEDLKQIKEYKKIIRDVNPDVVLTYTIKPNIYGTYAASKYKKPVIMNITGVGTAFTDHKLKHVVSALYKYACKRAHFVFFQNESNHLMFTSNKIVESSKTRIIPGSGVNIDKFKPIIKQNQDDIVKFLFIGRIMKQKGIEEYIEVAEKITKDYPFTEFYILGRFEEEKYKDIILNNKNLKIRYLGVSDDVRNEIKEIDCIIHPTFYPEGMSNVLLEGAAMGKPLIASNIPGCKEIIEEGINGYLFEPRNIKQLKEKVEKFLSLDNEYKKKMGLAGRSKVIKEFNRRIVIDAYLEEIGSL